MLNPSKRTMAKRVQVFCCLATLCLPGCLRAQPTPPGEIVRRAIENELKDDSRLHLFTWKERSNGAHGTKLEQLVSTPNGIIGRTLMIDGKPLSPEQKKQEDERIAKLLDPEQIRRKQKAQQEDDERTRKMLAAIPDAFDFMYLGSYVGPNGHKLTRIKFNARAGFNPPDRESMVFTAMQGEMLVDESANRLAKIDGTLFKEVNFGWGILCRLYRGGRFVVEQSEVTASHWETTRMILHFEGKALFVKPIHIDDNEIAWDFHPVPSMTVEQARNYLSSQSAPGSQPAQNAMMNH
jgi:hypothetical protein